MEFNTKDCTIEIAKTDIVYIRIVHLPTGKVVSGSGSSMETPLRQRLIQELRKKVEAL